MQTAPGVVDWPKVRSSIRRQGIELRGGGADEAPEAYKNLDQVLAEHSGTVRVTHRLRPIGVAMAGPTRLIRSGTNARGCARSERSVRLG